MYFSFIIFILCIREVEWLCKREFVFGKRFLLVLRLLYIFMMFSDSIFFLNKKGYLVIILFILYFSYNFI